MVWRFYGRKEIVLVPIVHILPAVESGIFSQLGRRCPQEIRPDTGIPPSTFPEAPVRIRF